MLTSNEKYTVLSELTRLNSRKSLSLFILTGCALVYHLLALLHHTLKKIQHTFSFAIIGKYNAFVEVIGVLILQEIIVMCLT